MLQPTYFRSRMMDAIVLFLIIHNDRSSCFFFGRNDWWYISAHDSLILSSRIIDWLQHLFYCYMMFTTVSIFWPMLINFLLYTLFFKKSLSISSHSNDMKKLYTFTNCSKADCDAKWMFGWVKSIHWCITNNVSI